MIKSSSFPHRLCSKAVVLIACVCNNAIMIVSHSSCILLETWPCSWSQRVCRGWINSVGPP